MLTSDSDAFAALQLSPPAVASPGATATGEFDALSLGIVTEGGGGAVDTDTTTTLQNVPTSEGQGFRVGNNCILITNTAVICKGRIGESGMKFCCDTLATCGVLSHQNRKETIAPGLYSKEKGTNVAYAEPTLATQGLDTSVVDGLLQLTGNLRELQDEMCLIINQTGTTQGEIDNAARRTLKQAMSYKTPKKVKHLADELNPSNLTELTSSVLGKVGTNVKMEKGASQALGEGGSASLQQILPNMAGAIDNLEFSINSQENLVHGFCQRVLQLVAAIGSYSQFLQGKGVPATVWGSVAHILEEMEKMRDTAGEAHRNLEDEVTALKNSIQKIPKAQPPAGLDPKLQTVLMSWKSTIQSLVNKTSVLEGAMAKQSNGNAIGNLALGTGGGGAQGNTTTIAVDEAIESVSKRVEKLEQAEAGKKKDSLSGAVRLGGITFSGTKDVQSWIEGAMPHAQDGIPPYGLFADPQLLLHWTWAVLSGSHNTTVREMKDRVSIDLSQDKVFAIDASQHIVPLIFSGKRSSLNSKNDGFGRQKT